MSFRLNFTYLQYICYERDQIIIPKSVKETLAALFFLDECVLGKVLVLSWFIKIRCLSYFARVYMTRPMAKLIASTPVNSSDIAAAAGVIAWMVA